MSRPIGEREHALGGAVLEEVAHAFGFEQPREKVEIEFVVLHDERALSFDPARIGERPAVGRARWHEALEARHGRASGWRRCERREAPLARRMLRSAILEHGRNHLREALIDERPTAAPVTGTP